MKIKCELGQHITIVNAFTLHEPDSERYHLGNGSASQDRWARWNIESPSSYNRWGKQGMNHMNPRISN